MLRNKHSREAEEFQRIELQGQSLEVVEMLCYLCDTSEAR